MGSLKSTVAVALLAVSFSVPAAVASTLTITIDDFDVNQSLIATADGNPADGTVTGPEANIIGGTRYMKVRTDQGQTFGTGISTQDSSLSFLNDPISTGTGWLVYDGTEDRGDTSFFGTVAGLTLGTEVNDTDGNPIGVNPIGVNTTGLNGVDLLLGRPTGFFTFDADNFDQDVPGALLFSAFLWDMSGVAVSYFEAINPLTFSPRLDYSEFRSDWSDPNSGQAGFRFDDIGAMAFRFESQFQGFDGQIRGITATPIPLPATALLLLGGLGGLAGIRTVGRRLRKA